MMGKVHVLLVLLLAQGVSAFLGPSLPSGIRVRVPLSAGATAAAGGKEEDTDVGLRLLTQKDLPPTGLGRRGMLKGLLSQAAGVILLTSASSPSAAATSEERVAVFSGGCFWCMEGPFDKLGSAVKATTSGYTGGKVDRPTYKQVSSGTTGHVESLQVTYDPRKITYEELLDVYWHQINPTQKDRQFCDGGKQYRSVIWYSNEEERLAAEASKQKYADSGVFGTKNLVTDISPLKTFWPAEDYHQDYYINQPMSYKYYRTLCGRDLYLDSIWGEGNH